MHYDKFSNILTYVTAKYGYNQASNFSTHAFSSIVILY